MSFAKSLSDNDTKITYLQNNDSHPTLSKKTVKKGRFEEMRHRYRNEI